MVWRAFLTTLSFVFMACSSVAVAAQNRPECVKYKNQIKSANPVGECKKLEKFWEKDQCVICIGGKLPEPKFLAKPIDSPKPNIEKNEFLSKEELTEQARENAEKVRKDNVDDSIVNNPRLVVPVN